MFCEKCGKEATQNAIFCRYCGSALGKANNNKSEALPIEFLQMQNKQIIEQSTKDESKSFLGGMHHPWRRFFARTVDLMLIGVPILLLFFQLIGHLFPNDIDSFVKFIGNPIFIGIVLYVLWLPVEALFLSIGCTTPAKWVFGIRVTRKSGDTLLYSKALKRAFLVFAQGDGFGIPLVILFTRLSAYRQLTKTGTTPWDTSVDSVVMHKQWGAIRAIASIFVTLLALVIMGIISQVR